MFAIRWAVYIVGLMIFSLGIATAIKVQHLGIHPWDVLNVALYQNFGLSIGSWTIIISVILIVVSWILDKSYIRIGTFLNAFLVGIFVDIFLWIDFLPEALHSWIDIPIIIGAIVLMGFGGGIYNAAGVGSGPRDGFMLSISDKTGIAIGKIRIMTECIVLVIGLLLGGPVFIFTFIFTFIQSPLFQFSYLKLSHILKYLEENSLNEQLSEENHSLKKKNVQ